jgi:hypothetical protein
MKKFAVAFAAVSLMTLAACDSKPAAEAENAAEVATTNMIENAANGVENAANAVADAANAVVANSSEAVNTVANAAH